VFDVDAALHHLVSAGGSDLHIKVPSRPLVRIDGDLRSCEQFDELSPDDTEQAVQHMLADDQRRAEWAAEGEVDFSYAIRGLARFRVSAFRQRGSASLVVRAVPVSISTLDELALPPVIRELAEEERGIVLLTGTTGSGKSTTLAAMIDHINSTMHKHVMTIEDPIEFLHRDKPSIINQREVGQDTARSSARCAASCARTPTSSSSARCATRRRCTPRCRRRDRPPRPLDRPHRRRARDDQPRHRLLPAAHAPAGARDARRHAEGRHLPAPRARRPTAAASRPARSCA
jgi:hypothetical protein